MVQRTRRRGCPPKPRAVELSLASSKQATLDGKSSCQAISGALWRHYAARVFAKSPTGRLPLSLTATGSSHPGVRPKDLRAQTFYVTLPPRTSSGPLNAKTREKIKVRQRATALLVLRQRVRRVCGVCSRKLSMRRNALCYASIFFRGVGGDGRSPAMLSHSRMLL